MCGMGEFLESVDRCCVCGDSWVIRSGAPPANRCVWCDGTFCSSRNCADDHGECAEHPGACQHAVCTVCCDGDACAEHEPCGGALEPVPDDDRVICQDCGTSVPYDAAAVKASKDVSS